MTSPARRHFERMKAAREAASSTPAAPQGASYELHLASIIEDTRRLHDLQSIERKIEAKRKLLPNYESYALGVLEGGKGQPDEVLMTVMIWHLDVGNIAFGLDIAEYALKHGLETPDRYQRSTAALVAEEVSEYVLKLKLEGEADQELLQQVRRTVELTEAADMHDQIRAKLYKALGYLLRQNDEKESALSALKRALELNDRVGVKKDIERLEKELNSGE